MDEIGGVVENHLAPQTADAWSRPTDYDVRKQLPAIRLYGNVKQPRLRLILTTVELRRRTVRHESVTLPAKPEIEHVNTSEISPEVGMSSSRGER